MNFCNKGVAKTLPVLGNWLVSSLIVLCAALIFPMLGCSGPSAEEVTAAAEREAYEKKITFTMPIEYTATVSQCDSRGCKTRLYIPSSRSK